MKKLTALVVLLTIVGTASFASHGPLGENSRFKLVPKAEAKYELIYVSDKESDVRITIFDAEGRNIKTNTVKDVIRFRRTFDFSKLEYGTYSIVVKNDDGSAREEVSYAEEKMKLQTFVAKIPERKSLKLHVGDFNMDKPVRVKIYNQENQVIHKDVISKDSAFSKVYTLAKDQTGLFTVQVENDGDFKFFTYEIKE